MCVCVGVLAWVRACVCVHYLRAAELMMTAATFMRDVLHKEAVL